MRVFWSYFLKSRWLLKSIKIIIIKRSIRVKVDERVRRLSSPKYARRFNKISTETSARSRSSQRVNSSSALLGSRSIWYLSILSISYETDPLQRGTRSREVSVTGRPRAAQTIDRQGGPLCVVWKTDTRTLFLCTGSCVVLMSLMSYCLHVCALSGADTLGMKGFFCVCVRELCRLVRTAYRRYVRYAHLVSEPVDVLVFMGVWCLIIRLIPAHTGSLFWKRLYHVTARSKTTCRVEITNRCTSVLCTYRCVGPDGDRVRLWDHGGLNSCQEQRESTYWNLEIFHKLLFLQRWSQTKDDNQRR